MDPKISVVIATHNRAAYLRKAVASLVEQTLDPADFEIIVVDNASSDETPAVAEEFAGAPNLRYLPEPVVGASRARNSGWQAARAEHVAFMDDDAVAEPRWLESYVEAFATFSRRPGLMGGRCDAIFEGPRPPWLADGFLGALSVFHWADEPVVATDRIGLSVCNMATTRTILAEAGGFREDIGRSGGRLVGNEDDYLRHTIESLGHVVMYHPGAVVRHHVSPVKMTKPWFRRRAFWQGWADGVMFDHHRRPVPARVGLTARRVLWALPRLSLALAGRSEAARLRRQCQVIEAAGYITGLWRSGV